jgi:hypothetical protein
MVRIQGQCKIIKVLYTNTFLFFGTMSDWWWLFMRDPKHLAVKLHNIQRIVLKGYYHYFCVSESQQNVWLKNVAIFVAFRLTLCHLVDIAQFVVWGKFSPVLFNISNVVYWQVAEIFACRPSLSSICCILYAPPQCVHARACTHTHRYASNG